MGCWCLENTMGKGTKTLDMGAEWVLKIGQISVTKYVDDLLHCNYLYHFAQYFSLLNGINRFFVSSVSNAIRNNIFEIS